MSKGVAKQCNILNYLRRVDTELYELLQDLCITKILIPRNKNGITFLRPDDALRDRLKDMAAGEESEKAVEALQSMVVPDTLQYLQDFDAGTYNYLSKKIQVKSADKNKVVLANGAEITVDPDFTSRKDVNNIAVYILSSNFVPTDGDKVNAKAAGKKSKKTGGGDIKGGKGEIFTKLLNVFCNGDTDPALELLIALNGWAKTRTDDEDARKLVEAIAAKASYDTLATLAIILRPYGNESPYLPTRLLTEFVNAVGDEQFRNLIHYTNQSNAVAQYAELATRTSDNAALLSKSQEIADGMGKTNATTLLANNFTELAQTDQNKKFNVSAKELFAEAELRAISAVMLDNCSGGKYSVEELLPIYKMCKLDEPALCSNSSIMNGAGIGFYYSTAYLIARSEALDYRPGVDGADFSKIASDNAFISLNKTIEKTLQARRDNSDKNLSNKSPW